ncbi:Regulator of chromosome condensation, partial [Globisporangium splendens]
MQYILIGVVYVDGIPIEPTLLDAGESGLKGEERSDPAALALLDPRQVRRATTAFLAELFDKYDTDGSGGIDFDEFKVLLRDLRIQLSEPKALAYFKKCDKVRRGSISFEEFCLALYTCDPKNPNHTMGFAPGQSLSPKDLFEMFDNEPNPAQWRLVGHLLSAIETTTSGGEEKRVGGRVCVAGSSQVLAKFTPSFTPSFTLLPVVNDDDKESVVVTKLSCGNAHTALISTEGELFTWGKNAGGCAGHSVLVPLVKAPTRVSCMYQRPANLYLRNGVRALQSTQNATCLPEYALGKELFAKTQQEACPFWQVTLQNMSRIKRVRVVLWKSTDGGDDTSSQQVSMATTRPSTSSDATLKYTILTSESAFGTEERGKYSLAKAKSHSTHAGFTLSRGQKEFTWTPPVDTSGCFARVQIDNATAMLSLSLVEIVGMNSTEYKGPKVSEVECGEAMTAVVCCPLSSMEMLRERLLRADRASLWILEQIETFHPFLNEELVLNGHDSQGRTCILCRPHEKCVVCLVEAAITADGKVPQQKKIVSDPSSVAAMKENEAKKREALRHLTLEEFCQRLVAINMRAEEEEETQLKQLEQELTDLTALAKQKLREEQEGAQLAVAATNGGAHGNKLLEKLRKALRFGKK